MDKQVIVFAGSGREEWKDGQGKDASFDNPYGITIYNDQIIVADTYNHRIRMIDIKSRMVSTLAGNGRAEWKDGQGEDASFCHPRGVVVVSGQVVVADTRNNRIRLIDMNTREVSTLAGNGNEGWKNGEGEDSSFDNPWGIAVYNDQIIVADTWNNRIRLINLNSRMVSTLAGNGNEGWKDGPSEDASFNHPYGIAIYNDQVIVADTDNNRIRMIDMNTREVSTLAGSEWKDGQGENASFNAPEGVAVDSISGQLVVADTFNHRIRIIDINTREVSTLAEFPGARGVTIDPLSGQVFVSDISNDYIRLIDNCFVGIFEWEKYVKQLFLNTSIPNPIVDIILMYCNYNFRRTLSPC
jgi:DNA-binding beta-propeller fold protein YncE